MWPIRFILTNPKINFYSHIPCGMWHLYPIKSNPLLYFYSHIPCGMWLNAFDASSVGVYISTHTSRVGCDQCHRTRPKSEDCISTHTSRVGCDLFVCKCHAFQKFLLTHPVWDVTHWTLNNLAESNHFYSHIPCGMWPARTQKHMHTSVISTHTSRVGCDAACSCVNPSKSISTHTSRVGCDVGQSGTNFLRKKFLLTHPVWDVTFFQLQKT